MYTTLIYHTFPKISHTHKTHIRCHTCHCPHTQTTHAYFCSTWCVTFRAVHSSKCNQSTSRHTHLITLLSQLALTLIQYSAQNYKILTNRYGWCVRFTFSRVLPRCFCCGVGHYRHVKEYLAVRLRWTAVGESSQGWWDVCRKRERAIASLQCALRETERWNSRRAPFMLQDKAHNRLHHPNSNVNTE